MIVKKMTMNYVLYRILKADDLEIQKIIDAVIKRYEITFPNWEISFLSLPKNDLPSRREALHLFVEFMERHEGKN